jgi:hypothetical protein
MTFRHCVAVDLGASSGRVMLACYATEQRTLTLREVHRFANYLEKTTVSTAGISIPWKMKFAWVWKKPVRRVSPSTVSVSTPGVWIMF